ncbi:MAG TPA: 4-aminobutyrate--2-oxoglutarate transaminase [Burkholderiaceae bacterium]|nr:4-aminobutyrate--2-oxoglutarate transaminase [Burkholderiaceae bacterium]
MDNQSWQTRKSNATPSGIGILCDFYTERALNAELWDVQGRRYIDFAAGIAVTNTGHCHPRVVAAISQQLSKFTHTAFQISPYSSYVELAEKINERAPGDHQKKTALFTTGAEAVENAVKIARAATGRSGVIAFSGAFHGRTFMGLALTGKVAPYKLGFGPFPGDVYHAPFPNALHGVSVQDSLDAIAALFKADIDPRRVAAIIVEPVQGEGGFYVAPPEFLRALRALCDQHGILLIADEVQTGFGRTGKMFAMEHSGVIPDLMTMAKSLAGGMPLSGVCGRAEIMDAPAPGALGGTYAGNPLAVASALAVLDIIDSEKLVERANIMGAKLRTTLNDLAASTPAIAEVRGLGAMIAVEFHHPDDRRPNPELAASIQKRALQNGLVLLTCGVHGNVIRFLFPLTIEDTVLDEGLHILSEAIRS